MKSHPTKRKRSRAILTVVAALPAAAVTVAYFRYRRDPSAAEARISSGSKLTSTPFGPIEYGDVGAGAPVFVIHGAGGEGKGTA